MQLSSNIAWHWSQDFWNDYYIKHPLLFFLLSVYTILGAMIFVTLERPEQESLEKQWYTQLMDFRKVGFENLSRQLFNTSELLIFLDPHRFNRAHDIIRSNLMEFEYRLYTLFQKRDPRTLHWDMWNASVFAMSTFTTIGYKNLYPITLWGKLAVSLYTLIGVPLLLGFIINVTSLTSHLLNFTWNKIVNSVNSICNKYRKNAAINTSFLIIETPFLYAFSCFLIWIFVCPATCLLWKPEWSYMDAFYFVFMSLSTVGMVGIDEMHPAFYFLIWFYIVFALAFISICFKLAVFRYAGSSKSLSKLHRSPPFQLGPREYNEDFIMSPMARNWINEIKTGRFSRAISECCDDIKSEGKTSLESFQEYHPFQTKLPFFSAFTSGNNKLSFKSVDAVNMLMDAYKEELLWLVRSGRYSSEEQSIADMNRNEDEYDTIIVNPVAS